jgi:hypothetical protein
VKLLSCLANNNPGSRVGGCVLQIVFTHEMSSSVHGSAASKIRYILNLNAPENLC